MKKFLLISSILLLGCLNTTNRHPYERHEASPVTSAVAPLSSRAAAYIDPASDVAPCSSCDAHVRRIKDLEGELESLRWMFEDPAPNLDDSF